MVREMVRGHRHRAAAKSLNDSAEPARPAIQGGRYDFREPLMRRGARAGAGFHADETTGETTPWRRHRETMALPPSL